MKQIELINKRKPREKHFLQEDGTIVAKLFDIDIHYLKNNKYEEIDNQLILKNGIYKNKNNSFRLEFDNKHLYSMFENDFYFKINLIDEEKHKFILSKDNNKKEGKGRYIDILKNIDIEYIVSSKKIKENIILKERNNEIDKISFRIDTNYDIENIDNTLYISKDKSKKYKFNELFAIDANSKVLSNLKFDLKKDNNFYFLTIFLTNSWFKDDERAYPIIIDPTITYEDVEDSVIDTYISQYRPDTNFSTTDRLLVGNWDTSSTTSNIYRSLIKFKLPTIGTGCQIINAKVRLVGYPYDYSINAYRYLETHRITKDWSEQLATWNNMNDKYDSRAESIFYSYNSEVSPSGDEINYINNYFDITNLVKKWYTGTPNYGIMIKALDETERVDFLSQFFSKENLVSGDNPKPLLEITYRNQNGLESYMTYFSEGLSDGSIYYNLSNGNMVFTHDLIATKSQNFPVVLTLVYNTNDVVLKNNYNNIGNGFKFNFNQRVFADSNDNSIICFLDKDSTIHYFKDEKHTFDDSGELVIEKKENEYYDDEGLGFVITKYDSYYIINDIDKNKLKFDITNGIGYLIEIETNDGYKTRIFYDDNQRISKIIDESNDELNITYSETQITLSATHGQSIINIVDNLISNITDINGEYLFTYNSNKLISSIKDNNFKKVSMEYYNNSPYKIKKVSEYSTDETLSKSYEFSYGFDSTSIKDFRGRVNTFCYNSSGNIISTTVKQIENDLSVNYGYTNNYGEYGQFINKILSESNLMKPVENLIKDSSYEVNSLRNSPYVTLTSSDITAEITQEYSNIGSKSLKINSVTSNQEYRERFNIYDIGDHTFSAYIKNSNKIKMFIEYYDSNSNLIRVEGKEIDSNSTFNRYDISFTCEILPDYITIGYLLLEPGTLYIDDIQLEKGNVCNDYNLIEKMRISNDFENEWNIFAASSIEELNINASDFVTQVIKDGLTAIKVNMRPDLTTQFGKTLNISGKAGDAYTICFWYKNHGLNLNDDESYNNVMISFNYLLGDDYEDGHCVLPGAELKPNEDEWQFYMESFVAEYDYSYFNILFSQNLNSNELFVSNISLFKGRKSSNYNYDSNGLLIGSYSPLGKESTISYDSDNLLSVLKNSNKSKLCYEYNKDKNVFKCFTNMSLSTEVVYDDKKREVASKAMNIKNTVDTFDKYYIRCAKTNNFLKIKEKDIFISNDKYLKDYWYFEPVVLNEETYYKIYHSIINNKYMSYISNGLKLKEYDESTSLFTLTKNENGSYYIRTKSDDAYLCSKEDNTLTFNTLMNDVDNFEFYIEKYTSKDFSERNKKYDNKDRLIQTTDELLNETNVEINELGLATKTTSGKNYSKITYDDNKRITKYNKNGGELKYNYDEHKLLNQVTYNDKIYKIFYDKFLNINKIYLGEQLLLDNDMDTYGENIVKMKYNNGNICYLYDNFGRVIEKTKSNDIYNYYYDNSGNMVKVLKGDYYYKLYYDLDNKIYAVRSSDFDIDYKYDELYNLKEKTYSINNNKYITQGEYDNDNNLIKTIYKTNSFETILDSLERITNNKINDRIISSREYYSNGYRQSTLIKKYSVLNDNYTFKFDKNYNIVSILKNNNKYFKYKYDSYNQLIEEIDYENKIRIKYTYDLDSNLKSIIKYDLDTYSLIHKDSFSYSNYDLLTKYNDSVIEYDQIGNVIKIDNNMLEWKNGKELTKFYNSNNVYNYYYNDNGVRTRKVVNNVNTYYYFEDADIFMEKNDNYTLYFIREFDGNLLGFEYNDNTYYYIKDVFDSIIGIIDSNYNIIVEYKYDTWGNIIGVFDENGNDISNNPNHIGNLNPYRYRGYYYDRETNLYYLGYRYYSPTLHRFISTDCATYDDIVGGNLYVYCNNNPVIKVDDNGKFPLIGVAIIGGILNAGAHIIANKINGKKISFKDTLFYFATGATGAVLGKVNMLLSLTTTNLADNIYDTVSDRKKENASNKKSNKKTTEKERRKNLREDIASVIINTAIDTVISKCTAGAANNIIKKTGGSKPINYKAEYFDDETVEEIKSNLFDSYLNFNASLVKNEMIEKCIKYPTSNKVIDINSPLYQPHDNRFYLVDTER